MKRIPKQKSETARAICRYYFQKNGETSIFDNLNEVENAIELAIMRGAKSAVEIRNETINFLQLG